ncbi:MAG: type II toxin-antitoxin system RelE/ParE family toxin [Chloroflexota bacterium]|nr:type II toxin-antitoxin system RelE/ParE family toxin [Chloroflexota bacterium]
MNSRPLMFVGAARDDLRAFPKPVRWRIGVALQDAQEGEKNPHAKPLKGFKGAGVLEVIEDWSGDTYRAVYTVRFQHAVYVLHCFQKKSTRGIATAKRDLDQIRERLREAEAKDREKGVSP